MKTISADALNMRRMRARRKAGLRVLGLEIPLADAREMLQRTDFIQPHELDDMDAIQRGLQHVLTLCIYEQDETL